MNEENVKEISSVEGMRLKLTRKWNVLTINAIFMAFMSILMICTVIASIITVFIALCSVLSKTQSINLGLKVMFNSLIWMIPCAIAAFVGSFTQRKRVKMKAAAKHHQALQKVEDQTANWLQRIYVKFYSSLKAKPWPYTIAIVVCTLGVVFASYQVIRPYANSLGLITTKASAMLVIIWLAAPIIALNEAIQGMNHKACEEIEFYIEELDKAQWRKQMDPIVTL